MRAERIAARGRLTGLVAALAVVGALAPGGARAGAATRPGDTGRLASGSGVISTVAGGVGGPALATKVALGSNLVNPNCGVAFGGGSLYIGDYTSGSQGKPGQ